MLQFTMYCVAASTQLPLPPLQPVPAVAAWYAIRKPAGLGTTAWICTLLVGAWFQAEGSVKVTFWPVTLASPTDTEPLLPEGSIAFCCPCPSGSIQALSA